jgi:hypothetical protein
LNYKLSPDPSAPRVAVWRKLKRLGAILFQNTVWVLPYTPRTLEQFQWLAVEITEMGGEATIWESRPVFPGNTEGLASQFQQQIDGGYKAILEQLEQPEADLDALSRKYQQILQKDYFQSGLGQRVRQELLARRGEDE